jgi:Trk K+ transport system NAD-binding subunit
MRVLIVGAQRLGRVLAHELLHGDHDVRFLDANEEGLTRLPEALQGRALHGSPLDRETLAGALAGCDALVALSPDDPLNAVVALAARRELRVPLAIAVIGNPARAEALAGLGVHVVCPTTRTARELHQTLVRSGAEGELLMDGEVGIYRADLPARLSGRTLGELERPGELIAIAIERDGRVRMAAPDLALVEGDVLHIAAASRDDVVDLVRP